MHRRHGALSMIAGKHYGAWDRLGAHAGACKRPPGLDEMPHHLGLDEETEREVRRAPVGMQPRNTAAHEKVGGGQCPSSGGVDAQSTSD